MTALNQINERDWMSKLENDIKMEYVNQIVEYSKGLKNEPNIEYIEFVNQDLSPKFTQQQAAR